jgi:hypothetical protein
MTNRPTAALIAFHADRVAKAEAACMHWSALVAAARSISLRKFHAACKKQDAAYEERREAIEQLAALFA